jgi:23S rRNA (cytosine1962-C5)-methyltransferase
MTPISHAGTLPWVQLRNALFHPSIFRKMVGRIDPKARNGDLVSVYDRDGQPFGTGLLSTQSQIGLRMLTFDAPPQPVQPVDESIIPARVAAAAALRRETLGLDKVTSAYRVVHAEGDGLPGLIVDRFEQYAVIELFSFPMYRRVDAIREELKRVLGVKEVLVRADLRVQANEGFVMAEDAPGGAQVQRSPDRKSVVITENGVRFQVDLTHGHKTGFFCDQRENRLGLTEFTPGEEVLDLCSYSGGFGVYAAVKGKASAVMCVDLDEDAIALAQRNANLNKVPRTTLQTAHSDAFPFLRQAQGAGKSWGVVVLDPPKLIPTREDFEEGREKYFDLNRLALNVVKPGGTFVTCSCSGLLSPEEFFNVVRGAARGARRRVQVLRTTGPGADHPVMTDCPESSYLKCLWCRVW